ncbi:hypothetical protein [Ciceribacter sp. RN22]|uniref:hypothetical protein n=1 Tax=Ciceribacter sp. RN22 TaxID=2954932 RepID=UPI002092D05D|nr:hypothetical protein [Ciceribacter sp. RN22]MCO6177528.1 hypothetical protein [Ciceribacter sp. RN22]
MPDHVRHDGGFVLAPPIAGRLDRRFPAASIAVDFMNGIKDLRPAPGITGL